MKKFGLNCKYFALLFLWKLKPHCGTFRALCCYINKHAPTNLIDAGNAIYVALEGDLVFLNSMSVKPNGSNSKKMSWWCPDSSKVTNRYRQHFYRTFEAAMCGRKQTGGLLSPTASTNSELQIYFLPNIETETQRWKILLNSP